MAYSVGVPELGEMHPKFEEDGAATHFPS